MSRATVFQEVRSRAGVETGDSVKEKGVGGDTVERLLSAIYAEKLTSGTRAAIATIPPAGVHSKQTGRRSGKFMFARGGIREDAL